MDKAVEQGSDFTPKFDADGLLAAVVVDMADESILMVGYMNDQALALTQAENTVHFFSRSRQKLWKKGETSGNILHVEEILVDCDQDALVVKARPDGPTCHTGERSCFYRRLKNGALEAL